MKLAIVGSTRFTDPDAPQLALCIIRHKLKVFKPELVISGGADGIDEMAAQCAREARIELSEFLPKSNRWAPYGFEDRNRLIATDCTHLLAIRDQGSKSNGWKPTGPHGTYGSGWTADEAERLGKQVERIVL